MLLKRSTRVETIVGLQVALAVGVGCEGGSDASPAGDAVVAELRSFSNKGQCACQVPGTQTGSLSAAAAGFVQSFIAWHFLRSWAHRMHT